MAQRDDHEAPSTGTNVMETGSQSTPVIPSLYTLLYSTLLYSPYYLLSLSLSLNTHQN